MTSINVPTGSHGTTEKAAIDDGKTYSQDVNLTNLLRNKMISSLKAMDTYTAKDVDVVSRLAEANIVSVRYSGSDKPLLLLEDDQIANNISQFVESLKSQLSRINTNELVLLLTFADSPKQFEELGCVSGPEMGQRKWQSIVDQTKGLVLRALANAYGFRPVRILVAGETDLSIGGRSSGDGYNAFSMTFLNVVNTDIGGPSMIQLLDHDHADPEWTNAVAVVEAWRDYDLLWRSNRLWMAPTATDDFEETSSRGSGGSPEPYLMPDISLETASATAMVEQVQPLEDSFDEGSVLSDSPLEASPHPLPVEHDAVLADRPDIVHPTWVHDDAGRSLLDLIKMQASQVPAVSSDAEFAGSEEAPATNSDRPKKVQSEDGFEIV